METNAVKWPGTRQCIGTYEQNHHQWHATDLSRPAWFVKKTQISFFIFQNILEHTSSYLSLSLSLSLSLTYTRTETYSVSATYARSLKLLLSLSLSHTLTHTHPSTQAHTHSNTLGLSSKPNFIAQRWLISVSSFNSRSDGCCKSSSAATTTTSTPSFLTDSHLLERERRNNNNNTINNNNINNNFSFNKSVAETQDLRSSRKKFSRKLNRSRKRKRDCDLFEEGGFFCKQKKILNETLTWNPVIDSKFWRNLQNSDSLFTCRTRISCWGSTTVTQMSPYFLCQRCLLTNKVCLKFWSTSCCQRRTPPEEEHQWPIMGLSVTSRQCLSITKLCVVPLL